MTTDQRAERAERTGFRLPWNSDRRSPATEEPAEPAAPAEEPATSAEEAVEAAAEAAADVAAPVAEPAAEAADEGAEAAGDGAPTHTSWVLAGATVATVAEPAEGTEPGSSGADNDTVARDWPSLEWPAEDAARAAAPGAAAETPSTTSTTGQDAVDAPVSPAGAGTEDTDMALAAATPASAKAGSTVRGGTAGHAAARPSKFMADLSRAMQAAAQAAREEALAKVAAEAKQRIEEIQQQGSSGTTELRRRADDDVAATREWAKAEIARIKEETDRRIAERKARLEADVEEHAVQIRRRADLVRGAVTEHEAAMAAFIEQLLAEEDPARIATLAQNMPEAPVFDDVDAADSEWAARPDDGKVADPASPETPAGSAVASQADLTADAGTTASGGLTAVAEAATVAATEVDMSVPGEVGAMPALSHEGAAAAEAEAIGGLEGELAGADWMDPRRGEEKDDDGPGDAAARTSMLVTGLSTVAGIAGFKRELSRVDGVRSVRVSAGDAGHFVFAISHVPGADLAAAIPAMTTFQATITGETTDGVVVTAVEPSVED